MESVGLKADTPIFVEYPPVQTRCRLLAQSGAGLTLGNVLKIIVHNVHLRSALGTFVLSSHALLCTVFVWVLLSN